MICHAEFPCEITVYQTSPREEHLDRTLALSEEKKEQIVKYINEI